MVNGWPEPFDSCVPPPSTHLALNLGQRGLFAEDRGRLDGERERFESPPYPSPSMSGTTTRGPSLTPFPPDKQEKMNYATRMM